MSKVQWTIQAPWGTIYTTWNLLRFMSGRPDFFSNLTTDYVTAVHCADTLAAGARSAAKGRCFLFADGWRVLDHSGRHAEIAEAAVSFPARLTWVVIQSPSGGKYRVGDVHRFEREKGLSQACGNALVAAIKRGIGKQQWPSPAKDGWTVLRPMEASEFRVIIDPQNVHYVFRSAPAKKLPSIKGIKAKANAEWTLCDGYGYAYKTHNLRLFLLKRPHIFPNADLAYTRLKQIIEMRCGTRSGSLILSNGWTAIDRSDVHDLIYNGPPGAEAAPEMPSTPGVCIICGKRLDKRRWKYCSAACQTAAEKERKHIYSGTPKAGIYRWFTCPDCGREVYRHIKCKRCEDCQRAVDKQRKAVYQKRGAERPLGSMDTCPHCREPYIVESSNQRYCKKCAEVATLENVRAHKRAYNAALLADPQKREETNMRKRVVPKEPTCLCCGKHLADCWHTYCPECATVMRRSSIRAYAARVRPQKKD